MYTTATCRRKAARFFENVHKNPCFLVHMVGYMHKKRSNLIGSSLSLGLLLYKFGLNLGYLLVNLVADEIHKMQQQFSVGYLENNLIAV